MLFWEEPWESYMASSTSGVTCWHLHAGYLEAAPVHTPVPAPVLAGRGF